MEPETRAAANAETASRRRWNRRNQWITLVLQATLAAVALITGLSGEGRPTWLWVGVGVFFAVGAVATAKQMSAAED